VRKLRDDLKLPGMVITQFGFNPDDPRSPHRIENHVKRAVAYTGTHDADPIAGWWESADVVERADAERAMAAAGIDEPEPHWALMALTLRSRAVAAFVQAQDVLGLGSDSRMNMPGVEGGNWGWKLEPGQLNAGLAARLREITVASGRATA
jgi:4-alpha-glucanotransferase